MKFITAGAVVAGIALGQNASPTTLMTFTPTSESASRAECVPAQCVRTSAPVTSASLSACLAAAGPDCQYTGELTVSGQTTDVCVAEGTRAGYVTISLPTSTFPAEVELSNVTGSITLTSDAPASRDCAFYAFGGNASTCSSVAASPPWLGNSPVTTLRATSSSMTVDASVLRDLKATHFGLASNDTLNHCGISFSRAVFTNFRAPFLATTSEATPVKPEREEIYYQFSPVDNSAAICSNSSECNFVMMPVSRAQVNACVDSVPARCEFIGVAGISAIEVDAVCNGNATSLPRNLVAVIDRSLYDPMGRIHAPLEGTIRVEVATASAIDCPVKTFRVASFDKNQNCGIVEPVHPSSNTLATLNAGSRAFSVNASSLFTDASLGFAITGPVGSCGTRVTAVMTSDLKVPFVYSTATDNPNGVSAALGLGTGIALLAFVVAN